MIKTVKGLVLRSVKYAESDKLITALTEEGMIFFKARGIRSITSKNAAGCALFVYSEFVLNQRGDKCFLQKAAPLYSTVRQGASLETMALASYFAEISEDVARDAETGKAVLRLLMNALYLLAKEDRPRDLIKAVFEMRLLAANGLTPRLQECSVCEKEADLFPSMFFRLVEGDLVCTECLGSMDTGLKRVSRDVIALCRHSVEMGEDKAYALKIPEDLLKDFSRFAEKYLINQLERKYKTLEFYHEVKGGIKPLEEDNQNESI